MYINLRLKKCIPYCIINTYVKEEGLKATTSGRDQQSQLQPILVISRLQSRNSESKLVRVSCEIQGGLNFLAFKTI